MCGDLKSMWALFGFCSGIFGKEQYPCCTIQRVDHYEKDGKIAWQGYQPGDPIPLSPCLQFVMCTLHGLLQIMEFSLEVLIADCWNKNIKTAGSTPTITMVKNASQMKQKVNHSNFCLYHSISGKKGRELVSEFKTQIQNKLKKNKWVPEKVCSWIGVGGRS